MKKRLVLLMTCLFASIGLIMAQERQITGSVVSETGEPLVGAYVIVEGANVGAMSGEDGTHLQRNWLPQCLE